jgi:hypothetical protein
VLDKQTFLTGGPGLRQVQEELLLALLRQGRDTAFGRRHGFDRIGNAAQYAQAVPIRAHDAWRPDIERIVAGEAGVLSTSPVYRFISSSGSSGGPPKVLPMTQRFVQEAFAPFYRLCLASICEAFPFVHPSQGATLNLKADPLRPRPKLANGMEHLGLSQVNFAQDFDEMSTEPGADSPWVQVPAEIDEELERLHVKLLKSAGEPVRALVGINPRTVANLARLLTLRAPELLDDVRSGMHRGIAVCAPRPDLADAFADKMKARGGHQWAGCRWPQLELVIAWRDGMASVYQAHLRSLFGPHVRFVDAPLGASEAPLTVPIYDGLPGGLLAYHTVYYEFLAVDGARRGEVLGAHELREGDCYSVIVSQQSGLHRYHLQDLVRVESHLDGIPRLSYQGRYVAGRNVQEHQWLDAVRHATASVPAVAFCAMPQGQGSWCVWIEFAPACHEADRIKACHELAAYMCKACGQSEDARPSAEITVIEVDPDGFHVAWQASLHAGRRAPQVKDLVTCTTPLQTGDVRQTVRCRLTAG